MADKTEAQPEALRLADRLIGNAEIDECEGCNPLVIALERSAAAELRRLHAEIQQLKAQLSARQAAPDGWRLVPVASTAAMEWAFRSAEVRYSNGAGRMLPMDPHSAFKAQYRDMLSAAPPPPEREPLSETEVRGLLESAGYWPGEDAQRADFINGLRYCEMAHGIGATND